MAGRCNTVTGQFFCTIEDLLSGELLDFTFEEDLELLRQPWKKQFGNQEPDISLNQDSQQHQ